MKLDLTNKNILITGAATGMGRASALEAAKHGANIAIVDINPEGLKEVSSKLNSMNANYKSFLLDVTSINESDKKIEQIHKFKDYDLIKETITNYGFELNKSNVKYIENSKGKGYEIKLSEKYFNNIDKNLLIFTDIDGKVINVLISK